MADRKLPLLDPTAFVILRDHAGRFTPRKGASSTGNRAGAPTSRTESRIRLAPERQLVIHTKRSSTSCPTGTAAAPYPGTLFEAGLAHPEA